MVVQTKRIAAITWLPMALCLGLLANRESLHAQQPALPGGANETAAPSAASEQTEAERIQTALGITHTWAAKYDFETPSAPEIKLQTTPLLSWSNPESGSIHGNVFLWTSKERPVVIGSLYQWFSPFTHMGHEFHSLSDAPLTAERSGRVVWRTEPGITLQRVTSAQAPAATAATRTLQMRQLARELRATKRPRNETNVRELRLLPSPVYRYDKSNGASANGALFAFVQGTDPEVFVWMEAKEASSTTATPQGTSPDASHWYIAFVRMNSIELRVFRGDVELWHADEMLWGDVSGHRQPYTTYNSRTRPIE